jgi:hypothetical protein
MKDNEGMSLVEAFLESEHTTDYLRDMLESEDSLEEAEHHAIFTYNMLELGHGDKMRIPVVFDDHRIVCSDIPLSDIDSLVDFLLIDDDIKSASSSEEIDEGMKPDNIIKRLQKKSARAKVAIKIIRFVTSKVKQAPKGI